MFFTLKSMRMDTVMRGEKFFHRVAFFADKKGMVFGFILMLACTPFRERGDMMYEFLLF
jgi:hypothetical protein